MSKVVHTLCARCLQAYRLVIEPSDKGLLAEVANSQGLVPCPRRCGGLVALIEDALLNQMAEDPRLKDPIHLTVRELYQACNGLGLPDELPQNKYVLEMLLTAKRARRVVIEQHERDFYLHELHLDDGVTLHLGAGLKGAHILKVTKERT